MTFATREATPADYPFLAQMSGDSVTRWMELDRKNVVIVATHDGRVIGALVARFDSDALQFEMLYLYVMRFYRRNRVARAMWANAFEELPPAVWTAHVDEKYVDAQCCLRQFGFRCVGTNPDKSLRFVRYA